MTHWAWLVWRMVSMMNALPLMSVPLVSVGSVIHDCHVVTKMCCSHLPRQSLSSSEAVSPDAVLCVGVPTLPAFLLLMLHQAVLEEEHLGGFFWGKSGWWRATTEERYSIFYHTKLAKVWRTSCEESPKGKAGQEAAYFLPKFPRRFRRFLQVSGINSSYSG